VHLKLTCERARDHRLARARGAEEQQPGGRRHLVRVRVRVRARVRVKVRVRP